MIYQCNRRFYNSIAVAIRRDFLAKNVTVKQAVIEYIIKMLNLPEGSISEIRIKEN